MIGLLDCNNFYVSCERVFNPKLIARPVVVLSNNDGCVIARSNESKTLGIPMGAPYFEIKTLLKKEKGVALSSNYALYGDMSERVLGLLQNYSSLVQPYSIDEAFFDADQIDPEAIRQGIQKQTGVLVSIGFGRTKTLAKVANSLAKKGGGIFILHESHEEEILGALAVDNVWGIGYRYALSLKGLGIASAKDFREKEDAFIRKKMSVAGLRIASELRGTICFPLSTEVDPRQSIACSRMFGRSADKKQDLLEAISSYAAKAALKLRRSKLLASSLAIYVVEHNDTRSVRFVLNEPTDYTPQLIFAAKSGIEALFRERRLYKKVGLILEGLVPKNAFQKDLFGAGEALTKKREKALTALDSINKKMGANTLAFAAEGIDKGWAMRQSLRSPRFTTRWNEILQIKI